MSDSDEEIEWWQNRLHKVTVLNYKNMTRSLHYVSTEVRDFPTYDGLGELDTFLDRFEREMMEKQCF